MVFSSDAGSAPSYPETRTRAPGEAVGLGGAAFPDRVSAHLTPFPTPSIIVLPRRPAACVLTWSMDIMKDAPIAVIGSANVDLIMRLPRLPARGETITGGEFSQVFGGKGANAAVAAARAGGRVAFAGCVGDDVYGPEITAGLRFSLPSGTTRRHGRGTSPGAWTMSFSTR